MLTPPCGGTASRQFACWTKRRFTSIAGDKPWQSLPARGSKVFVAMSGGVDSSVTARMLLDAGYDVRPIFMRNWDTLDEQSGSGGCEWERDFDAVQHVCKHALGGVTPRLLDLSRQYWTDVFQRALDSWQIGQTPNPDVTCNQHIKFKELPAKLRELDPSAWIATGHYARLLPSPIDNSLPGLFRATNPHKDQSYYLSTSPVEALKRTIFPLGNMDKSAVRDLARKFKLSTADRRESMGICFIGHRDRFSDWLESYMQPQPGDIVDLSGRVVGRHRGLWRYTIGEGARLPGQPQRLFVGHKDIARNTITVVPRDCEGRIEITLEEPITGVAPGQAVVLYLDDWCLGGGTIASTRTLADEPDRQ
ncbi:hypothetical protein OIV83_001743 [Microbotryomycetes sp. JL201]|nr:hypothetical protein OIV83_001743 [Microbotryomycetes sp. JL201]